MSEEFNNETNAIDAINGPSTEATASTSQEPVKKKHSKLGITSFILAFVAGLVGVIGIVLSTTAVIGMKDPQMMTDPNALMNSGLMTTMMLTGSLIIFASIISFVGLVIGIIALFMKNVKKGFAIAGTIMNAIPILLTIVFMIIGLSMQSSLPTM